MYEAVAFLFLSSILLGGMLSLAADEVRASRSFFQGSALDSSLDAIFYAAESLPVGSQERLVVSMPPGIANASFEGMDGEWVFSFDFNGHVFRRQSKVRIVFIPSDLLELGGTRSAVIEKESEESAVVKEQ